MPATSSKSEVGQLAGIRVLDLASVGPAARCSRMLADYGADIVKVGPPPRKGGKQIRPPFFSYGASRGMRRIELDLKDADALEAFLQLAEKADVIIESFRPGVTARIGIDYEKVRERNPRIVYCSTSGYGQDDPYSQWAGHDLNYLAIGGFLHCSGRRADGGPTIPGATVADSAAGGMHAAMAILAALVRRATSGEGGYLDVAVADGVLSLMSLHIDEHLAVGTDPGPGTSVLTGRYAYYDVYRARDGGWLAVGAIEPAFFANLCRLLECEQFIAHQNDDDKQAQIRAAFTAVFATRDRDDWTALLAGADTCVTPVYAIDEVVADEHFAARRAFVEVEHPEHGSFRQVGPVLAGGDRDRERYRVGSSTHTDEILSGAGLAPEQIRAMRDRGALA